MSNVKPKEPNWNELVNNQLINLKKRTSQIKGETMDNLTEIIAEDFKAFSQIAQQLVAQIDQRDKTIVVQNKTIEDYESAHPELKIAREKKAKIPPQTKPK